MTLKLYGCLHADMKTFRGVPEQKYLTSSTTCLCSGDSAGVEGPRGGEATPATDGGGVEGCVA